MLDLDDVTQASLLMAQSQPMRLIHRVVLDDPRSQAALHAKVFIRPQLEAHHKHAIKGLWRAIGQGTKQERRGCSAHWVIQGEAPPWRLHSTPCFFQELDHRGHQLYMAGAASEEPPWTSSPKAYVLSTAT